MNKITIFAFLLVFICFGNLFIYGQKTEINQETFLTLYNKMLEKTDKLSQRTTFLDKIWETGSEINSSSETIVEFVPMDKIRFVSETNRGNKSSPLIEERIIVGVTEYKKDNFRREWRKNSAEESVKPYRNQIFAKGLKNAKWFITENVSIGDENINLYEEYIEYKRMMEVLNPSTHQLGERVFTLKHKYWITKDNLLIRSESELTDNKIGSANKFKVYLYEYDSNIKIETPID